MTRQNTAEEDASIVKCEAWVPLQYLALHYGALWGGGAEHARCNFPATRSQQVCESHRCRDAGAAISGLMESHDFLEMLAAPLGVTPLSKVGEGCKRPYALIVPAVPLLRFASYVETLNWLMADRERAKLSEIAHDASKVGSTPGRVHRL